MIVPNKFTTLDNSLIAKIPGILEKLPHERPLTELYADVEDAFEDTSEFIVAMDVLFVLGRVSLNSQERVVTPC
jgi:hypothetical protein